MLRFQVLSSAVEYHSPIVSPKGSIQLRYWVFPYEDGELKFSDGNRLVARDLSDKWGGPLNIGDLYGAHDDYPDVLHDGGKTPIRASVIISAEDQKKIEFLHDEEFACGYAKYSHNEYRGNELVICLFVQPDILAALLQAAADSPEPTFFDIDIRGLKDEPPVYWPGDFEGTWDLADASDCGKGEYRVVTGFSFERTTDYFAADRDVERSQPGQDANRQELEKLHAELSKLVAIENGQSDGALAKLLRWNLLFLVAIAVVAVLALLRNWT